MRLTLQRKFFLALALLLVLLLAIFVGSSRYALQRGIGPYVAEIELSRLDWLVSNLERAYAAEGSWGFLQLDPGAWHRLQMFEGTRDRVGGPPGGPGPSDRRGPPPGGAGPQIDVLPSRHAPPPPPDVPGDPRATPDSVYSRLSLIAADGHSVLAGPHDVEDSLRRPIDVQGRTVGYLALVPIQGMGTRTDRAFVAQQSAFLLATGAAGLLLALLISAVMARRWLQPVQQLADGAQSIAQGRLGIAVAAKGDDELAQLARTFNDMSAALARVEQSRQDWLADVAHELRTPVAAMRAEIEAVQDGVRSFDARTAQRMHAQVMRLGKLVEDLQLAMTQSAPAVVLAEVRPLQVVIDAAEAMQPRLRQAQLRLEGLAEVQALSASADPVVAGDAARLGQVFMNLLENSARYTHAGGRVLLQASISGNRLRIAVDDTAPAPAAQDLPRLFERFYRADASRSRSTGGSGLGLSICRAIVQAHGGTVAAQASDLGGLRVSIELPMVQA